MSRFEKRLSYVTSCISFQNDDDEDEEEDGNSVGNSSSEDENIIMFNNNNVKNIHENNKTEVDENNTDINEILCRNLQNIEIEEKPEKIRRHLPPGSGKYSVGCVDVMDNDTEDGCFCRLFYPIEKTDIYKRNTQWPLWLPRKQYGFGYAHFLKRNHSKLFGKFFNWLGGDVYIPTLWQAPIIDSEERFPVLVLSHGIGGNRTTYSTFCCEMASHGYIVAAVEHRDGSASMTYMLKDNMRRTVVEVMKDHENGKHKRRPIHRSHSFKEEWKVFEHTDPFGIQWDDYDYRNKQVFHRAKECTKLLDLLGDINEGKSVRNMLGFHFSLKQFRDRMDMSRVALVGHSFGGSTCVSTLGQDTRFKVGIMMDAWMHPVDKDMCTKVEQPVLMVNYEKFQWKSNVEQMKWMEKQNVDRPMITILGACHQAISDFQFLTSKYFGRFMEVRSELNPKVAMDLNKKATLAFLAKHLNIEGINGGDDVIDGRHEQVIKGTTFDLTSQL